MQNIIEQEKAIAAPSIRAMRYSGATLRQIANKIGRTKERVRQILINNYGSTKHKLLSTRQLCKLSGLSRNQVIRLSEDNIITPVKEWNTSNIHYTLWSLNALEQAKGYSKDSVTDRPCKICHSPVPIKRRCYCSKKCYKESKKYKYRSPEVRERHRIAMKRYKELRKQVAKAS